MKSVHMVDIDDKVFWFDKKDDYNTVSGVVLNKIGSSHIFVVRDDNDKVARIMIKDLIAEYDAFCTLCETNGSHKAQVNHVWKVQVL